MSFTTNILQSAELCQSQMEKSTVQDDTHLVSQTTSKPGNESHTSGSRGCQTLQLREGYRDLFKESFNYEACWQWTLPMYHR